MRVQFTTHPYILKQLIVRNPVFNESLPNRTEFKKTLCLLSIVSRLDCINYTENY